MKARRGPTACEGMAVPTDKLDDLVASHLEERLLQPERLESKHPAQAAFSSAALM